jgi:hypothetical protein
MSEERMSMPPASFEFLIFSLRTQAEMNMGLYNFGGEEDGREPNLDLARHAIDLLAVIQEKTKGNLSLEEDRLLGNSVTELRFRFVQASDKAKQSSTESSTRSSIEEPPLIVAPDGSNPEDTPRIIIP